MRDTASRRVTNGPEDAFSGAAAWRIVTPALVASLRTFSTRDNGCTRGEKTEGVRMPSVVLNV
jgi:hypothetical protein